MFSNAPVICEEAKQVAFDGGSILHLILWEDTGLKYISCVISNFRSTSFVFDDYPENLTTTNNTHKRCLTCFWHDADIDVTKLSVQNFLKYLKTEQECTIFSGVSCRL